MDPRAGHAEATRALGGSSVSDRTLHADTILLASSLGPLLVRLDGLVLGQLVLVRSTEFAEVVGPILTGAPLGMTTTASSVLALLRTAVSIV